MVKMLSMVQPYLFSTFQFSAFIKLQVQEGKGRLRPGVDADSIIKDMFNNQDPNKDGKIVEYELKVTVEDESEKVRRDEL